MTQQRSFLDVADWVRRFNADPIEVLQARDEWLVSATSHVEDPGVSDIEPDFIGLTRVLVAWADHTGIDRAGALRELCRELCAIHKPGVPWGHPGISEAGVVGWDVRHRIIEDLMAQAVGVVERITDAAFVRAKNPPPLPPLVLDPEHLTVSLAHQRWPITEDQCRVLQRIIDAEGGAVQGEGLKAYAGSEEKPHKIIAALPESVRKKIGSRRGHGGGYWLIGTAEIIGAQ